jgi:hypothetical protein
MFLGYIVDCVFTVIFFVESPNLPIENGVWFFVCFPIGVKSSKGDCDGFLCVRTCLLFVVDCFNKKSVVGVIPLKNSP